MEPTYKHNSKEQQRDRLLHLLKEIYAEQDMTVKKQTLDTIVDLAAKFLGSAEQRSDDTKQQARVCFLCMGTGFATQKPGVKVETSGLEADLKRLSVSQE